MTITNQALNLGFAAEQAARVAAADRAGAESVAERLRQTAGEGFRAGTTVTARYRYKVGDDGSFIPLQTQITTEDVGDELAVRGEGGRRNRQALRQQGERAPSFKDFAFPRPQLSPADEAVIFSSLAPAVPNFDFSSYAPKVSVNLNTSIAVAEVQDESGNLVQAEIIAPKTQANAAKDTSEFSASFRRAQFSVASLYARSGAAVNQPVHEVLIAA